MKAINYTSVDNLIAKILRDTKLSDSSYIDSITEWIIEATNFMESSESLVPVVCTANINFYKVYLPKHIRILEGVLLNGKRLAEGHPFQGVTTKSASNIESTMTLLKTVVGNRGSFDPENPTDIADPEVLYQDSRTFLIKYDQSEYSSQDWYRIVNSKTIEISKESGTVELMYFTYELDKKGLPKIPDDVAFRNGCYWYVRMKLIESGWQDPVFKSYEAVEARWLNACSEGSSSVAAFTPAKAQRLHGINKNLIMPDFWETNFDL